MVIGTAVSEAIKSNLVNIGIPSQRILVDYLGVDIDFFKTGTIQELNPGKPVSFLQISNFVEKKGHIYTIKAFKEHLDSTNSNDILIFGGSGPLYDEMNKLSNDLKLHQNIRFIGLVDKFQVKELMEQAHFFVHHSVTASNGDTEGLPTVLMEAMAMNLPCISTFHAGIPEIITSGQNGLLVKERDIENMAKAFSDIKKLDCEPRSIVENKFNLKKNTQKIAAIFESLINQDAKSD